MVRVISVFGGFMGEFHLIFVLLFRVVLVFLLGVLFLCLRLLVSQLSCLRVLQCRFVLDPRGRSRRIVC